MLFIMGRREFLTKSQKDVDVYYDPFGSHAATHFADSPGLKELCVEIISHTDLDGEEMLFEKDMGYVIGVTDLVYDSPGDEIVYAKRKNRDTYTPFNKTKQPEPSSLVSLGLKKQDSSSYELLSAWIGSINSPPFPGDKDETAESKPYWMSHSLVWGTQEVQPGTETSTCPW